MASREVENGGEVIREGRGEGESGLGDERGREGRGRKGAGGGLRRGSRREVEERVTWVMGKEGKKKEGSGRWERVEAEGK